MAMRGITRTRAALLAAAVALSACGAEAPAAKAARARPLVLTTLYPVHYFAQRIAGELAEIECVVPPDADPLLWRPDAAATQRLQGADLILLNGAAAERWLATASLPGSRVIETAYGFRDRFVTMNEGVAHSHGSGPAHKHEGTDPHTWMDPRNAKAQAESVSAALQQLLPGETDALADAFAGLVRDLDMLDAACRGLGSQPADEVLVASHPAYNYLAQHYGWRLVNLDLDPEETLSDDALAAVRKTIGGRKGRYVLWESEPVPALAAQFERELGLKSLLFAPCETAPGAGEPDYLASMRANLERLAPAF